MADWEVKPILSVDPTITKTAPIPVPNKINVDAAKKWNVEPIADSSPSFRPNTWQDSFRNTIAPTIRGGMVSAGATGGGTVGSIGGAASDIGAIGGGAAGATLGSLGADQLYQLLQRLSPRTFGSAPNNTVDSVNESAQNGLVNAASEAVIPPLAGVVPKLVTKTGRQQLGQSVINLFHPNPTIPGVQAALTDTAGQELKPAVSQFTQNSAAQHLEDILTSQEKLELFAIQQKKLAEQSKGELQNISKGKFEGIRTGETSPADIGASATTNAQALYDSAKNSEKARWNNLLKIEVPKETTYTTKGQLIQGPINTNATTNFAQEVVDQLDQAIAAQKDPDTIKYLTGLKARVEPLTILETNSKNGQPVMGFEAAKDLADRLSILSKGKDAPPEIKREIGLMGAVSNLLHKDINTSVSTEWGLSARQAFNRATTKTEQIAETFYNKQGNDLLDYTTSNQAALEHALSSKEAAMQFKKATGRGVELGTEFTRNILDNALDANSMFDGKKALEMFNKSGDVANVVLTSTQRSSLTNLFRRMQGVDPNLVMSGQAAVAIRKAGAVFGIGGALLSGGAAMLATGSVPAGLATGTVLLASLALTKPIVEKLLLNPKNVNLMAQLSHLPPKSSAAQDITKLLFKSALKSAQFQTQYGNMQVNEEGKLESVK